MHYYLGPWVWNAGGYPPAWQPPEGALAAIDLRSLEQQATAGGTPGLGFFASPTPLDSAYTLLGTGDCRELNTTGAMRDAWESVLGYRPQGSLLVDLLWDQLTTGSDPDGEAAPKPLMPTVGGSLELHLGGHSRVKREIFRWGEHPHTAKVRDLLQREYRKFHGDARLPGNHHRRVLDFWQKQYGLKDTDWREFVPVELRKGHRGPLKHETTITESFVKADSATLGPDLTWTEYRDHSAGDAFEIVSNRASAIESGSSLHQARAETPLSSADHYAQVVVQALGTGSENAQFATCVRFASGGAGCYGVRALQIFDTVRGFKVVGTTLTDLGSAGSYTPSVPFTLKTEINGSALKGYVGGVEKFSVTDTAVTGNLYTGIGGFRFPSTVTANGNAFEAADLAVARKYFRALLGVGV